MKIDLSSFDLTDPSQLRKAATKLVAVCEAIPQLRGREKLDLVMKTLKDNLPEENREQAEQWIDGVLPNVVDAILHFLPPREAEAVATVVEVGKKVCCKPSAAPPPTTTTTTAPVTFVPSSKKSSCFPRRK
jgi:hypothetical protein